MPCRKPTPTTLAAALSLSLVLPGLSAAHANPLTSFIDAITRKQQAADEAPAPAPEPLRPQPNLRAVTPPRPAPAQAAAPARPEPAPEAAKPVPAAARQAPAAAAAPGGANKGGISMAAPKVPAPAQEAEAVDPSVAPEGLPTTKAEAIQRINDHFNRIDQLTANIVQTGGYGQRVEGTMALKRPAHFRFAYAPPVTLEIVSDGVSVAIRDPKTRTNDVYSVSQTPLKFLVKEPFDITRDTKFEGVRMTPDGIITANFEDSSTFGGKSKIEIKYDALADKVKQWVVVDSQGLKTTVQLHDVEVVYKK